MPNIELRQPGGGQVTGGYVIHKNPASPDAESETRLNTSVRSILNYSETQGIVIAGGICG